MNAQVHGEGTDTGQIITGLKHTFHKMVAKLLHDLAIGRSGGVEVDLDLRVCVGGHLYTVRVQYTAYGFLVKDNMTAGLKVTSLTRQEQRSHSSFARSNRQWH